MNPYSDIYVAAQDRLMKPYCDIYVAAREASL